MSEDAEPYGADVLRLEVRQDPTGTTIALEGEFDMTGSERFSVLIDDALAANARSITLHAGGLEFIDSSGLLALLRARDAVTEAGVEFRISDPSPALRRIVEATGLEDLLPVD
jgi:anti-anti-sigma factor